MVNSLKKTIQTIFLMKHGLELQASTVSWPTTKSPAWLQRATAHSIRSSKNVWERRDELARQKQATDGRLQ
jgi:hypothetical protein